MGNYDDIINLQRPTSKHPKMSLYQRSAQFAPFAALTGYDGQVKETSRLTFERKDFNEEYKCMLDRKMQIIKDNINMNPKLKITYFKKDTKKDGGDYITVIDYIRKIDEYREVIVLKNEQEIPINDIIELESNDLIFY